MPVDSHLASRRVGRRIAPQANSTARVIFGPFEPGEGVYELVLKLTQAFTLTIDPVTGVATGTLYSSLLVQVDVRAFAALPGDTSALFIQHGRAVYGDGVAGNMPRLPVQAFEHRLPVGWRASARERFLGIEVSELNAVNMDGSVFCVSSAEGG